MESLAMQEYCLPKKCIAEPQTIIDSLVNLLGRKEEITEILAQKGELSFQANLKYSKAVAALINNH